jgi:hypothetical protein
LPARLRSPAALAIVAVCLAATVPYLSTVGSYFLGDDFGLVHLFMRRPLTHTLTLFDRSWTETIYGVRTDELRPTLAFSYQLDGLAGGGRPAAFHVTSILLHVLTSLLVYAMARGMAGLGVAASAFAGALFGVMGVHAEAVAWISGRADSIPTFFYLGAVVAWARWRATAARGPYFASLAALFLGLFSKQSAITMVPMLVSYDLLVAGRRPWRGRRDLLAYLPHTLLTVGYLALRFVLFGNVVRERQVTAEKVVGFVARQRPYFQMMAGGLEPVGLPAPETYVGGVVLGLIVLVLVVAAAVGAARGRSAWGVPIFFGPVWWLITVTPMVVTYLTPRHLYLASAGFAVLMAVGCEALWRRGRIWRGAAALLGGGLFAGQLLALLWAIGQWNAGARLSERMVADIEREALAAPPGTLLLIGAPSRAHTPWIWTWRWAWAMPYALEPPFMSAEVARRVFVVYRPEGHCCPGPQWSSHVKETVSTWAVRSDRPPIVALAWALPSGALTRRTERDDPQLRAKVLDLPATASPDEMRMKVHGLLAPLGGTGAEFW